MTLTPADLERIEREVTYVPNEDEYVCNRCGIEYSLDDNKEPSALCHSCAQQVVTDEMPALIALARRALELESALDFLYRNRTVPEVRPAAKLLGLAKSLGWPGLQSEGGKEQADAD